MTLSLSPVRAHALPTTSGAVPELSKKPTKPELRHRSTLDNVIGYGLPAVMSGVAGFATAKVAMAAAGKAQNPWIAGAIGAGMTGFFLRGTMKKWAADPSVATPDSQSGDWKSGALRGAGLGAVALGGAAAVLMGGRGGMGAALAGKGVLTSLKFAGKAALPWALAMGAAGAALGAVAGATAKSPDAAMSGVTKQAAHTGLKWGGIAGGAAGVLAAGFVGFKTHNAKMAATAGLVGAGAGALYIGQMVFTQSATWNATSVWANTPKRYDS